MASDPIGHGLAFWDEEKARRLQKVGDTAVSACKGMEIQAKADKPFNSTAGEKCSDKVKERLPGLCAYRYAKQADKFLEGLNIKSAGLWTAKTAWKS